MDFTLELDQGLYSTLGTDIDFLYGYAIILDQGTYEVIGNDVLKQMIFITEPITYFINGRNITLRKSTEPARNGGVSKFGVGFGQGVSDFQMDDKGNLVGGVSIGTPDDVNYENTLP